MAVQRTEVANAGDDRRGRAAKPAVHPPALLVVGSVVASARASSPGSSACRSSDSESWSRGRAMRATARPSHSKRSGAEVLLAPTVEVRPISDPAPLDAAIDRLASYDWLVFTSANGVRFFIERLTDRGRDLRALGTLEARRDRSGDRGRPWPAFT